MNARTLQALLRARGWSQSELARRVGVSRQAVSLWLRQRNAPGVRSQHLLAVGEALGVPVEVLLHPLPGLEGEDGESARAALLWDGLYPDLVEFAIAAGRLEPKAVGRLIEVHGIYPAARILGPSVWKRFEEFARFIHPVRRRQLEALVRWRRSRTAA